ncbi:MAG: hypothetical protein AAGB31_12800 [Bdellovibrio sp.]
MAGNKTTEIETLILRLLDEGQEVSIRSVAKAAEFSKADETKRKAIRRALLALENRQVVEPRGAGRSRVYVRPQAVSTSPSAVSSTITSEGVGEFKDIPLSVEARDLFEYVSQSLQARPPVGYNQNFLRAYNPNKTFYLSAEQRQRLLAVGRVEIQTRPAGTYARNQFHYFLFLKHL